MRKSEIKKEHIDRINFAVQQGLGHRDWEPIKSAQWRFYWRSSL